MPISLSTPTAQRPAPVDASLLDHATRFTFRTTGYDADLHTIEIVHAELRGTDPDTASWVVKTGGSLVDAAGVRHVDFGGRTTTPSFPRDQAIALALAITTHGETE